MKNLSKSWFIEGRIDFEQKKYILLAYLQYVNRKFTQNKLYPHLSELVSQYRNLNTFLQSEQYLYDKFPHEIAGFDPEKFKLAYKKVIEDEELMYSIRTIVEWSLSKISEQVEEGKEIHDFIEKHINFAPVGVEPLRKDEGYLLLLNGDTRYTSVFSYEVTLFEQGDDQYRSLRTKYLKNYQKSIINHYGAIKKDLIQTYRSLPNPATYSVETEFSVPLYDTFLPVAKRILMRYLSQFSY
jgi:hypothetical protein